MLNDVDTLIAEGRADPDRRALSRSAVPPPGVAAGTADFAPVIIAPTYNNAATVVGILERAVALGLPVILVNDGCTDSTADVLDAWRAEAGETASIVEVVHHSCNLGKGRALLSGFAAAAARGYTHAATIDTDGQLDPASIPSLLRSSRGSPTALVLGVRSTRIEGCPARSLVGRRLSNLAIRCECGVRVRDSQCGLRVYPLSLVAGDSAPACRAGRFAFEAEVITRAAWAGVPIEEVEVACRYLPPETRVSHFKPWRDSMHGAMTHARLIVTALAPGSRAGRDRGAGGGVTGRELASRARSWFSPARLWREVRAGGAERTEVALGFAVGVFIANLPIYGVQSVASLYVAHRLHLHPLPVVAGSHVSTPPLGFALVAAAIAVGHLLLHGVWIWDALASASAPGIWTVAGWMLLDWVVGSLIVGLAAAMLAFVTVEMLLRLFARRRA